MHAEHARSVWAHGIADAPTDIYDHASVAATWLFLDPGQWCAQRRIVEPQWTCLLLNRTPEWYLHPYLR